MVVFLAYAILAIITLSVIAIIYVLKWIFDFIWSLFPEPEPTPDHKITMKDIDSWYGDRLEESRKSVRKYSDPNHPTNQFLDIIYHNE